MNTEQISKELHEIKLLLKANKYGDDTLWDADQVADYIGLTKDYASRTTMKHKDFPKPHHIKGTSQLRWKACEIKRFYGK